MPARMDGAWPDLISSRGGRWHDEAHRTIERKSTDENLSRLPITSARAVFGERRTSNERPFTSSAKA